MDKQQWQQRGQAIWHGALQLKTRMTEDMVMVNAGYLAYVTLLSLVPLLTVMLTMFSAFPVFSDMREHLQSFVFSNFVPAAGEVLRENIENFLSNVKGMTSVGLVALVFSALLQIYSIDKSLNRIWRTRSERRILMSFAIYWMVLTLGPVLLGLSMAATSYLVTTTLKGTLPAVSGIVLKIFPFLVSWLAFLLLYLLVPNKVVPVRYGVIGSLSAALLFEISKRIFALYIANFPSYQAIYGALAAVPILFVWVYLSWLIVLFGAELTAFMDEHRLLHPAQSSAEEEHTKEKFDPATGQEQEE